MTATERVRGGTWMKIRRAVLDGEPLCRTCLASSRVTAATEIDHITPLRMGGHATDRGNLQPLCWACHNDKTLNEAGDRTFSMMPQWLHPKGSMTVVCGPPGAGKTTYVAQHAKPGDVVLDLDDIIRDLFGIHGHDANDLGMVAAAIRERNARLGRLTKGDTAWLIAGAPSMTERQYWQERGATVVLINPGHIECIRRTAHRQRDYTAAVMMWFADYGTIKAVSKPRRIIASDGWPVA